MFFSVRISPLILWNSSEIILFYFKFYLKLFKDRSGYHCYEVAKIFWDEYLKSDDLLEITAVPL